MAIYDDFVPSSSYLTDKITTDNSVVGKDSIIDFNKLLDSGDILQTKDNYTQVFVKKDGQMIQTSNKNWSPLAFSQFKSFMDKDSHNFLLRVYRPKSNNSMNMNYFFRHGISISANYDIIYESSIDNKG